MCFRIQNDCKIASMHKWRGGRAWLLTTFFKSYFVFVQTLSCLSVAVLVLSKESDLNGIVGSKVYRTGGTVVGVVMSTSRSRGWNATTGKVEG